jgi:hypothetical protein
MVLKRIMAVIKFSTAADSKEMATRQTDSVISLGIVFNTAKTLREVKANKAEARNCRMQIEIVHIRNR